LGLAVKTATIFPDNARHGIPNINGAVCVYSDHDGTLEALVDFHLVTKWKTAGDSLLAASKLARKDSKAITIIGAGTVAHALREAYGALFPGASFTVWNRSASGAQKLAQAYPDVSVATDLETAVRGADIVTTATMSTTPLIKGEWLRPGQHVDLIGAYRADMREADDTALTRSRIFVDSRDTTLGHIGELMIPLENGTIQTTDIVADFYDMLAGNFCRRSNDEITVFKNGGGAHLDLITSKYIQSAWRQ
jgi:ornithine cyclodeaminase/alanine dehydrogenase-like protein (mu-crystallin family)